MHTIAWVHGGCFTGGSAAHDVAMRGHLESLGMRCVSVDYDRSNLDLALASIRGAVNDLASNDSTIVLGGVSSGGYLAHRAANEMGLPALLLCPVIDPVARHDGLPPRMQTQQLDFFGSPESMMCEQHHMQPPTGKRLVFVGEDDWERAPRAAMRDWEMRGNTQIVSCEGDHALCAAPPLHEITAERLAWLQT